MVTDLDAKFGQLLRLLKDMNLENDTVVFFCSDNGGTGELSKFFNSNGPLRAAKGSVYEGGIRIPMIVRWPGKVANDSVSGFPWAFSDFLPTAAEIAGARTPAGLDGISVMPVLTGKKQTRGHLYWEQHGYNRKAGKLTDMQAAVRLGEWKAVRPRPKAAVELYNLTQDPGETKDVTSANRDVAAKLEALMKVSHSTPRPHDTGNWEYTGRVPLN